MSVLAKSSIKVNTKFIFEPVVINSSMVAPRDSMRSRFHVELGRFTLNFQKGIKSCKPVAKFLVLEFVLRLISCIRWSIHLPLFWKYRGGNLNLQHW